MSPFGDEETVKKQYRKLALTLHPDKNESLRAEGAFKLVSEAWGLLSDKTKRLEYNQNRMKRKEVKDAYLPELIPINLSATAPFPNTSSLMS